MLYFKIKGKNASFADEHLNSCLGSDFLQMLLFKTRYYTRYKLDTFERTVHLVNDLLCEKKLFLRLYEKKNKFKYVSKKGYEKNEVQKEISSCVEQRFNSFQITCHLLTKKQKVDFESLGIIYKPAMRLDEIIECYFTSEINLAFRANFQHKKD